MINIPSIHVPNVLDRQSLGNSVMQRQCTTCKAVVEIRDGIETTIKKGIFHIPQQSQVN